MGLVSRSYICATCISLFILYNYYCLLSESSEYVARRYFVVVRGKTAINAVCANRIRWGVRTLLGHITLGLARSVLHTPLTRFKAICFAWVIEEIEVARVNISLYCSYKISVYRIVVAVNPHHAPTLNQLAPMLADYRFNVLAFRYH